MVSNTRFYNNMIKKQQNVKKKQNKITVYLRNITE